MINLAFSMAEAIWILAGREDLKFVNYFNKNIAKYSDDGETFNAAYGYRMRHARTHDHDPEGHDQLEDVIKFLKNDPNTRHAAIVYRDPVSDSSIMNTEDRACNLISHFLYRNNRLHMSHYIRSSDTLWGIPYNLVQFSHILRYVAARLGWAVGDMTFHIHSGHIYQDLPGQDSHREVREWDPFKPYHGLDRMPHFENRMDTTDPTLLATMVDQYIDYPPKRESDLTYGLPEEVGSPFWQTYFNVFEGYIRFKHGYDDEALDWTIDEVPWPYNVLLAKNFFTWRWHREAFKNNEVQRMAFMFGMDMSPRGWFLSDLPDNANISSFRNFSS